MEYFHFSDDGDLMAMRYDNGKLTFLEQRVTGTLQIWAEPMVQLRVPELFNLRTDPYERADITSNTYYDWMIDHVYLYVPAQQIVAQFLQTFVDYPPRPSWTTRRARRRLASASTRCWRSSRSTAREATDGEGPARKRLMSGGDRVMSRIASLLAAIALLASVGCATIEKSRAMDTERSLAAAGFQMKFAKTPAQIAKAEALPQRKITPAPGPDGKNRFVYADASYCKCVYVGTEEAYDRYQRLAVRQQIAENEEAASMNWGAWGGWGPWW